LKVLLREVEKLQITKMNVRIYELEQGLMLGEDNDDAKMKYINMSVVYINENGVITFL